MLSKASALSLNGMLVFAAFAYTAFAFLLSYFWFEDGPWHISVNAETYFWGIYCFFLTSGFLFLRDSPVYEFKHSTEWWGTWLDIFLLWFSYVGVRAIHRFSVNRELTESTAVQRRSRFRPRTDIAADVRELEEKIGEWAKQIQFNFASSTQRAVLSTKILGAEECIIGEFEECPKTSLNYLLKTCNLTALMHHIKNHTKAKNKSRFLTLLCKTRLNEAGTLARAAIIDALQKSGSIRGVTEGSSLVADVICNTYGQRLLLLKNLMDNGGDYHSVHKLVFRDVTSIKERERIVRHIQAEAQKLRTLREEDAVMSTWKRRSRSLVNLAEAANGAIEEEDDASFVLYPFYLDGIPGSDTESEVDEPARTPMVKVLSDVDDTLYCSGGDGIAGIDKRFPKKFVYPGVLQLYKQLDMGADGPIDGIWAAGRLGNLAFLSARPHVYKDVSENASYRLFEALRESHGLYVTPTLLAGDFKGIKLVVGDFSPIAEKKFKNYEEYSGLYPEYDMIFIGDNGQADVKVAEMMSERSQFRAAFIHKVQPVEKTFGYTPDSPALWRERNIFICDNYVEAAWHACNCGLISEAGAREVALSATETLGTVCNDKQYAKSFSKENLREMIQSMNESILKVNSSLLPDEEVPLLDDNIPDTPQTPGKSFTPPKIISSPTASPEKDQQKEINTKS